MQFIQLVNYLNVHPRVAAFVLRSKAKGSKIAGKVGIKVVAFGEVKHYGASGKRQICMWRRLPSEALASFSRD